MVRRRGDQMRLVLDAYHRLLLDLHCYPNLRLLSSKTCSRLGVVLLLSAAQQVLLDDHDGFGCPVGTILET